MKLLQFCLILLGILGDISMSCFSYNKFLGVVVGWRRPRLVMAVLGCDQSPHRLLLGSAPTLLFYPPSLFIMLQCRVQLVYVYVPPWHPL
ncbi:hypothetical protein BDV19DRAFT_28624 [Aspergillus venezuelensis]